MSMRYFCCDDLRRSEIAKRPELNGIDFLEVLDNESIPLADRQRTLFIHFINDASSLVLNEQNVTIKGGEREAYRDPPVESAQITVDSRSGSTDPVLVVEVEYPGDFSIYTLRLTAADADPHQLDNFDPVLRAVDFSFKANCQSDFDCTETRPCPVEAKQEPVIDYLARDYNSFRQLMLDRLSVLMPNWKERNPADVGIALVELLAYVGDYLSYRQDAVATEAYLDTARRRVSVRRHARLVDYYMHDGCNARVWVHAEVSDTIMLEKATQIFTAVPNIPDRIGVDSNDYRQALGHGVEVFETLHNATLYTSLNEIEFYTWGSRECCLPKGATRATLRGRLSDLQPGMILIFQEVVSPRTGDADDADPRHRHAVRLTNVTVDDPLTGNPLRDPIGGRFDSSPTDDAVDVTEITWAEKDALPFPLCITAESDEDYGAAYLDRVSIAMGNIVLADHGRSIKGEELGAVPQPKLEQIQHPDLSELLKNDDHCRKRNVKTIPARFRPKLKESPVTQAVSYNELNPPASAFDTMHWNVADALPVINLNNGAWRPQRDLLNSGTKQEFVVETEAEGKAFIRFGDGKHGARPASGSEFVANYRIGNGTQGNVGADTLVHIVSNDSGIVRVANPLPARGGVDMESIDQVRAYAPQAFKTQKRAVTPDDYATIATSHAGVQKAAASLRWTGSWHTVYVNVDRIGGAPLDDDFEILLRDYLEPYRMAGNDLEVDHPSMVPLEVAMLVDVQRDYERSQVRAALLKVFSNRALANGRRGVFHPDNFTFGQAVFLSPLYAAAQAVEGVKAVEITSFKRQHEPDTDGLDLGQLPMGRFEIPRLDNDLNFPGRGAFQLTLRGGR